MHHAQGNGITECLTDLWPIVLFVVMALTPAVKRCRQTLD